MKNPQQYIEEIRANLQKKMQSQGRVEPAENALLGIADGLAGLQLASLNQIAELTRRVETLEAALARAGGRPS
jgi:hypothetical protein